VTPRAIASLAVALALLLPPSPARAQRIGTDLTGLNLCLYGDCEARGAYAADPFGWANPATLPVGILEYVQRGVIFSPAYFRLTAGGVGADIEAGTVAVIASPVVIAATGVYAHADGTARTLPGVDLDLRLRTVRLLAGIDLDRAFGVTGLAAGLTAEVPGTTSDLTLSAGGVPLATVREDHELNVIGGLHWRGGTREWFMAGAFLNVIRNPTETEVFGVRLRATANAWLARFGVSLLPFVPTGLADGDTIAARWLGDIRVGADMEYRNIASPGEGAEVQTVGYFGMDAPVLPDAWNPLSRWLRLFVVGGVDTQGGWGIGLGLFGHGPLEFVGCTPSYSSRPRTPALGDRTDIWSATCGVQVPF
jgi:hypothetical protein